MATGGFSYLEVLIAALVAGILSATAVAGFYQAERTLGHARKMFEAGALAGSVLEDATPATAAQAAEIPSGQYGVVVAVYPLEAGTPASPVFYGDPALIPLAEAAAPVLADPAGVFQTAGPSGLATYLAAGCEIIAAAGPGPQFLIGVSVFDPAGLPLKRAVKLWIG
jgi:type II secretory pathway pseudopilin PulG